MPKQAPETWNDDEINKFLGSRGHTPATPGTAPPVPAGTAPAADPSATGYPPRPGVMDQIRGYLGMGEAPTGRPPSYGEMDWQQAAGQGMAREGASLLTGAARLAGKGMNAVGSLLPEKYGKNVSNFVEKDLADPTFQRWRNSAMHQLKGPPSCLAAVRSTSPPAVWCRK